MLNQQIKQHDAEHAAAAAAKATESQNGAESAAMDALRNKCQENEEMKLQLMAAQGKCAELESERADKERQCSTAERDAAEKVCKELRKDLDAERERRVYWMQLSEQQSHRSNEADEIFNKTLAEQNMRIASLKEQISSSRGQTPRHGGSRLVEVLGDALPKIQAMHSSYMSQIGQLMQRVRELEDLLNRTNQKCLSLKTSNEKYERKLIEMTLKSCSTTSKAKKGK